MNLLSLGIFIITSCRFDDIRFIIDHLRLFAALADDAGEMRDDNDDPLPSQYLRIDSTYPTWWSVLLLKKPKTKGAKSIGVSEAVRLVILNVRVKS